MYKIHINDQTNRSNPKICITLIDVTVEQALALLTRATDYYGLVISKFLYNAKTPEGEEVQLLLTPSSSHESEVISKLINEITALNH